jgi:hypothetical protein
MKELGENVYSGSVPEYWCHACGCHGHVAQSPNPLRTM